MTTIPLGRDPTGIFRELTLDADGRLMVASGGGQTLPLTTGVPADDDQALVVTIKSSGECMPVAPVRTAAAIALGGNADSVVAVDNWTPVTSLLDAIRTSTTNIDAPTSDLLAQLESLAASAQGQATEATAQDARDQLLALLNRLPTALVNGALAVTGTVFLAPGTTVGITGPVPLPTGAATDATLASRATETTQAQVLGAVDTLEAGQATGNASLSTLVSRSPTLVGGKVPVDASGSSVSVTNTVSVETELAASGNLATEAQQVATIAALASKATETTAQSIASKLGLSAAQEATLQLLGTYLDGVEGLLATIRDRLAQRTSDPAQGAAAQVVRVADDRCTHSRTAPGTMNYFLQAATTARRLCSYAAVNHGNALVHIWACSAAAVNPTPAVSTQRLLGFADGVKNGVPGAVVMSAEQREEELYPDGILLVASSSPTALVPMTTATLIWDCWHKAPEAP